MPPVPSASPAGFEKPPMSKISDTSPCSAHELQIINTSSSQKPSSASWRSLFAFTRVHHLPSLAFAMLSSAGAGIPQPVSAIFYGYIFSDLAQFGGGTLSGQETLHKVSIWCICLTVLGVISWGVHGGSLCAWTIFGELQARTVRKTMFEGLLEKDMEWYDLRPDGIGSLLIRIQTQIRELQLAISQPLGFLCTEFVASLLALGIAFYFSWKVTLVVIASVPIMSLVLFWVSGRLGPAIEAQKRELSKASKHANTAITNINTVKAFNGQEQEVWHYSTTIKKVAAQYLIQARANAFQFGITKFATVVIFIQGFWYGLVLVRQGLNPGHVLTAFYACLFAIQAVEVILPQWLVLTKGMSAGKTLKTIILEMQGGRNDTAKNGGFQPSTCSGDIEINNISFAYPTNPHQDSLKHSTFFFPAGETTFVVGESGSGKSTIGNLLMRYYETTRGEIFLDSQSLKSLDTDWLRRNITLVQQDSVFFNETISRNIALGTNNDASYEDLLEAARTADLHGTLMSLPEGLNTIIGSNGKSLSGGQQQRIAIARARLRDSPILILDEYTSALDPTSQSRVTEEVRKWRQGKTTIIITHDVSQIPDDGYVYVLENGAVVQEGYRNKLASKEHGKFSRFVRRLSTHDFSPSSINDQRRKSEPVTPGPISAVSSESWVLSQPPSPLTNRISRFFATPELPSIMPAASNRMSLGFGAMAVEANYLRAHDMWSSPLVPEVESHEPHRSSHLESRISPQSSLLLGLPHRSSQTIRLSPKILGSDSMQSPKTQLEVPTFSRHLSTTQENSQRLGPPVLSLDTSVRTSGFNITEAPMTANTSSTNISKHRRKRKTAASLSQILRTIWPTLVWKQKLIFAYGFFTAFALAAATPVFAFIFAQLLGTFYITENQSAKARRWSLALLGCATLEGLSAFSTHYSLEYCGQAWVNVLRVEALKRILAQPKSWFDKQRNSPERLSQCLDRDAEEMRNLVGRFAGPVFTVAWMLAISVVWSLVVSWRLTLVALACGPIMFLVTRLFDWWSSVWEHKCNEASATSGSIFSETFSNIRVVRALTLENYLARKHNKSTLETYKIGRSRATYSGLLYGLTYSASLFITALVFYYATLIIIQGHNTVEHIIQVVNLLLFGIGNSAVIIGMVPQINSSRTTATYMLYLAHMPIKSSHETQGRRRLASPFPVQFKKLSFTYPSRGAYPSLKNITLAIEHGTCTALVGASGSGKSTIASLLLGLYPPDSTATPSLTFADISINELNTRTLRSFVGYVSQTTLLFPATIYENIIYGLPESSQHARPTSVTRAATDAGIHEFIMTLEHGYQTPIGDGGMGLSGGQTQRIAIARALVRKPKLLILDEATSALDAVNTHGIKETIRRLMDREPEMAVLIISHDEEMMRVADRIVVLENGRIVEIGEFRELRASGGKFSALLGRKEMRAREDESAEQATPVKSRTRASWHRKGSVGW